VEIGSGHVVRCTTLARRLVQAGHDIQFVCRKPPGNVKQWLKAEGFHAIEVIEEVGGAEADDARACRAAIGGQHLDWIVVDHYALSAVWERAIADLTDRILVIDDLGREHDCHLLLDQNYPNPTHERYSCRVSAKCELLLGPKFALVRPEFAALRAASLSRPRDKISRLLVFMGGTDPFNETCKALNGIGRIKRTNLVVDVVIGDGNPHRRAVETACAGLRKVTLHVQTTQMAKLVAEADCVLGAGGSAIWERCALGVPALVTILAENQARVAEAVHAAGGHRLLGWHQALAADHYAEALLALDSADLRRMSNVASQICDGRGVERVAHHLTTWPDRTNRRAGWQHA
jgi:UDP-2,4-diacetamido-2,4,6-trideoxy-beta-L-altropyranose hydrolase